MKVQGFYVTTRSTGFCLECLFFECCENDSHVQEQPTIKMPLFSFNAAAK